MEQADYLKIAEETLKAMNSFADRMTSFLKFPPDEEAQQGGKFDGRDGFGDVSHGAMPRPDKKKATLQMTEKDVKKSVTQCQLRFAHVVKGEAAVSSSQASWELGEEKEKPSPRVKEVMKTDWQTFGERARLWTRKQSQEPRSAIKARARETPQEAENRDREMLKQIDEQFRLKYHGREYLICGTRNPLFEGIPKQNCT